MQVKWKRAQKSGTGSTAPREGQQPSPAGSVMEVSSEAMPPGLSKLDQVKWKREAKAKAEAH